MKISSILLLVLVLSTSITAQLIVTEVATLPEPVSNNAVCEGFIENVPYLFSFGGIDGTKIYSGVHLKSFRYNIETGESEQIADLPDNMGKIAAAASRIGNIIYIIGGYSVLSNGNEISSDKVHRYDIVNNLFLSDAAPLLRSTDDHVQGVWRDSLIYVITGWSDNGNIRNVQIYNPAEDDWTNGTPLPGNSNFTSFGASGTIITDTIFYYGGAADSPGFSIQNQLRKGVIDPDNPTQVEWSFSIPEPGVSGYRMAATKVGEELHWIGGSETTYNYDGMAYDGTGGVPPSNRDLYLLPESDGWQSIGHIEIPMDLRGIANISDTVQYIAGGMLDNQEVTDKIYKLEWERDFGSQSIALNYSPNISIFPNPVKDYIIIDVIQKEIVGSDFDIINLSGQEILSLSSQSKNQKIDLSFLPAGMYYLRWKKENAYVFYPLTKL